MATRFVTTYECDASDEFKNAYINAKKEGIKIINSPVGMPGRAIYNNFIKNTEKTIEKIEKCYRCIKTCNIRTTPYCITKALVNSVKGNIDNGLIFCGSNVYRANKIVSVHNLMQELVNAWTIKYSDKWVTVLYFAYIKKKIPKLHYTDLPG